MIRGKDRFGVAADRSCFFATAAGLAATVTSRIVVSEVAHKARRGRIVFYLLVEEGNPPCPSRSGVRSEFYSGSGGV